MVDDEGRERLAKEIDLLTEENRTYVLGVSEALVFAQKTMNRPEDRAPSGRAEERDRHTGLF